MKKPLFYLSALFLSASLIFTSCGDADVKVEVDTQAQTENVESNAVQIKTAITLNNQEWSAAYAKESGRILDVRTYEEYVEGHIEGSTQINVKEDNFIEKVLIDIPNKEEGIFVYCRSGGRSKRAMEMLAAEGYTRIYNLENGITGWAEEGYPVEK